MYPDLIHIFHFEGWNAKKQKKINFLGPKILSQKQAEREKKSNFHRHLISSTSYCPVIFHHFISH